MPSITNLLSHKPVKVREEGVFGIYVTDENHKKLSQEVLEWWANQVSKTYKNVLCFLSFMVCSNGTKYEPIHMAASSLDSPQL